MELERASSEKFNFFCALMLFRYSSTCTCAITINKRSMSDVAKKYVLSLRDRAITSTCTSTGTYGVFKDKRLSCFSESSRNQKDLLCTSITYFYRCTSKQHNRVLYPLYIIFHEKFSNTPSTSLLKSQVIHPNEMTHKNIVIFNVLRGSECFATSYLDEKCVM